MTGSEITPMVLVIDPRSMIILLETILSTISENIVASNLETIWKIIVDRTPKDIIANVSEKKRVANIVKGMFAGISDNYSCWCLGHRN